MPMYSHPPNLTLPEAMDWHTKGAVSSVKDEVSVLVIIKGPLREE